MSDADRQGDVWKDLETIERKIGSIERFLASGTELAGVVKVWAGPSAPHGYLFCDGLLYPNQTYPQLFAALGGPASVWGLPDDDHFNVPDLRGRVVVGVDGSITLGSAGGAAEVTLTSSQMPSHAHGPQSGFSAIYQNDGGVANLAAGAGARVVIAGTTGSTGGGGPHDNMQPYSGLHFIIKF